MGYIKGFDIYDTVLLVSWHKYFNLKKYNLLEQL